MEYSEKQIFELLTEVEDPEIPVLNIVEMGIVRSITKKENTVEVDITPTYPGCPAMKLIEDKIKTKLKSKGIKKVKVIKRNTPAWTTDWLTEDARKKLRFSGIAPPESSAAAAYLFDSISKLVGCPYCNSSNTTLTVESGSTACKSLYYCNNCNQPFEYLKSV